MEAIVFVTEAQKGTIKIPKEYPELMEGPVQVIIVRGAAQTAPQKTRKKRKLSAVKIKTKGLKFSRVEANER